MAEPLLRVQDLVTCFKTDQGTVRAVDGVSFSIQSGHTIGLVGESGSGKSVTSLSILGLLSSGNIESGSILFAGQEMVGMSEAELRKIRGNRLSMVFQEPMTSLNPLFTIGDQVGEVFRIHRKASRAEARRQAIEMLKLVSIPAPEKRVDEYPHELSGGMRQRVMIAMALSCRPQLLIADEPTTALDVTIQAQILELMRGLQQDLGTAILLITHDLGVVSEVCRDVMVMYAGRIVESAPVRDIFRDPRHPYTVGLLQSIPKLGQKVARLPTIEGTVPHLARLPRGCRFQDRCPKVFAKCREAEPPLVDLGGRQAACWLATS